MRLIGLQTIKQIITGYGIELKGTEPQLKCVCPFHADTTPSMSVNTKDNVFYCHGCGVGGNTYAFVMKKENCDFVTARRKVSPEPIKEKDLPKILKKLSNTEIKNTYEDLLLQKEKAYARYFVAHQLLERHNIITLEDTNEIFVYMRGVYYSGEKLISSQIQQILHSDAGVFVINEILGHLRRETYIDREELDDCSELVCLSNGVLDLKTMKIIPHSHEYHFFNKVDVNFIPGADCKRIKEFLPQVVADGDVVLLQELVGYCLYKRYPIHKAIMLVGVGANGKSTFINILKKFLGAVNCASIPLQNFEINRFATSLLHGKLANLFADLPAKALKDTSFFKMLTGEDLITAERKFRDGFCFMNYAKMIFSCNQIPMSPDESDAFFRRWLIIVFPNQFLGESADKTLSDKLTTDEELSGLLNFAIEGLKRLLHKGEFTHTTNIEDVRADYVRRSDSVGAFVMDCVVVDPDAHVEKKKIYTTYCDYCRHNSYPIVAENTFHRYLQKKVRVEEQRIKVGLERSRCWRGISLDIKKGFFTDMVDSLDSKDREVQDVQDKSFFSCSETKTKNDGS